MDHGFECTLSCYASQNYIEASTTTYQIFEDCTFVICNLGRTRGGGEQGLYMTGIWTVSVNGEKKYTYTADMDSFNGSSILKELAVTAGDKVSVAISACGDRGNNGSYYGCVASCDVYLK